MKFNDIVALAKQGYTPQDIKDLMSLSEDQGSGAEDEQKDHAGQQTPDDHDESEPEAQPDKKDTSDDLDYKALFEAEQEKTAKLQKMVLSADLSDKDSKESDADIFADVMKTFM